MKLIVEIEKTQVLVRRNGLYGSLLFNPMDEADARLLAREYGYTPDEVWAVVPLMLNEGYEVDDAMLAEALESLGVYGEEREHFFTGIDHLQDGSHLCGNSMRLNRKELMGQALRRLLPAGFRRRAASQPSANQHPTDPWK